MIKKFLLSIFVLSIMFGFGMKVNAYTQLESVEYINCMDGFSSSQRITVQNIWGLFVEYAAVIEQKYPGTNFLVEDYISMLDATFDCNGGFDSYAEFELATVMFLKNVSSYNGEVAIFVADSEAEKAILNLQKHLIDLFGVGVDYERPFKQTTDLNFELVAGMDGEEVAAIINLDSVGNYDLSKGEFDANVYLDFGVDIVEEKLVDFDYTNNEYGDPVYALVDMQIEGNLDVDVLQKDNMYLKLNGVDVSIGSTAMSADELMVFDMMKGTYMGMVETLKGQYINVTDGFLDGMYEDTGINPLDFGMNRISAVKEILEIKPLMKFAKTEELNQWEGVFTDDLCGSFTEMLPMQTMLFMGSSMCDSFQEDFLNQTNGQGYLTMKKVGSDYSVGFAEVLTSTTNYEEIFTWNNYDLKKISFPFEDSGYLLYENNQLDITYDDGYVSFDIDGSLGSSTKTFDINFVIDEETQTILEGTVVSKQIGLTFELFADFIVMEEGIQVAEFSLENREVVTYLSSLNIQAPAYVKTLSEIEEMFLDAFGGF